MTRFATLDAASPPADTHADPDPQDRLLIVLRDELYEGRWDLMRRDLRDRLEGKPYIFKLVNRIHDDLRRIDRLEQTDRP